MSVISNPSKHFQVVLSTGAGIKAACESVFGDGLYIIKDRANSNNWQWIDYVRGTSSVLQSNTTAAETTYTAPTGSSVGYCWKAGGTAVTNTAGSITSQVSANTTAGFSVVTYTGTGANATVGHGLGVAPKMVIVKARASANVWRCGHDSLTSWAYQLIMNDTPAQALNATIFNSTAPTSDVFSVGTSVTSNESGKNMLAYCFAEVAGFSKAFSFTGNASTDGVCVNLGFKPRFILLKCSSTTGNWYIFDTARNTYNVLGEQLYPNLSNAGSTVTTLDVLSNGFKARIATDPNAAQTYIGFAIAESPFALNNRAC